MRLLAGGSRELERARGSRNWSRNNYDSIPGRAVKAAGEQAANKGLGYARYRIPLTPTDRRGAKESRESWHRGSVTDVLHRRIVSHVEREPGEMLNVSTADLKRFLNDDRAVEIAARVSGEPSVASQQMADAFLLCSVATQQATMWLYIWMLLANIAIRFRPATFAKLEPILEEDNGWRKKAYHLFRSLKSAAFGGGRLPRAPGKSTLVGVLDVIEASRKLAIFIANWLLLSQEDMRWCRLSRRWGRCRDLLSSESTTHWMI